MKTHPDMVDDITDVGESLIYWILAQSIFVIVVRVIVFVLIKKNEDLVEKSWPWYLTVPMLTMYLSYFIIAGASLYYTDFDKGAVLCADMGTDGKFIPG